MDLTIYYDIIVEPILSTLLDLYNRGGISFEDAQSIGVSLGCITDYVDNHSGVHLIDTLIDEFDFKLERIKARKLREGKGD